MTYTIYNPHGASNFTVSDDDERLLISADDYAAMQACSAMTESDYVNTFFAERGLDISDDESEGYPMFYRFCGSAEVVEAFREAISNMSSGDVVQLYGVTIEAE